MLSHTKAFGWVATASSLIYKLPQIAHLFRTTNASGINPTSLYIQASSYIFLITHGVILDDWPIIVMGMISLLQSVVLIILYHQCVRKEAARIKADMASAVNDVT